jgi:hypothetical protein
VISTGTGVCLLAADLKMRRVTAARPRVLVPLPPDRSTMGEVGETGCGGASCGHQGTRGAYMSAISALSLLPASRQGWWPRIRSGAGGEGRGCETELLCPDAGWRVKKKSVPESSSLQKCRDRRTGPAPGRLLSRGA